MSSIPLLAVQAHQDTIAHEQRQPHKDVVDVRGTLAGYENEEKAHTTKQEHEYRVKEAEGKGQNVFMDESRDDENSHHGNALADLEKLEVSVDVSIQPVMDHNVPCAVVVGIRLAIPPVLETKKEQIKRV